MKYFVIVLVLSILTSLFFLSISFGGIEFARLFKIKTEGDLILANVFYVIGLVISLFLKDHFIIRMILVALAFAMLGVVSDLNNENYIWVKFLNGGLFMLTFYLLDEKQQKRRQQKRRF